MASKYAESMGWPEESRDSVSPAFGYEEIENSIVVQQERERYETALNAVAFQCNPVWLNTLDDFAQLSLNMVKTELLSKKEDERFDSCSLEEHRTALNNGSWEHHLNLLKNNTAGTYTPGDNNSVVEDLQVNPLHSAQMPLNMVETELLSKEEEERFNSYTLYEHRTPSNNDSWPHYLNLLENNNDGMYPPCENKPIVEELHVDPMVHLRPIISSIDRDFPDFHIPSSTDTDFGDADDNFWKHHLDWVQTLTDEHEDETFSSVAPAEEKVSSYVPLYPVTSATPSSDCNDKNINACSSTSLKYPVEMKKVDKLGVSVDKKKILKLPILPNKPKENSTDEHFLEKTARACVYSNPLLKSFVPPSDDSSEDEWKNLVVTENSIRRWTPHLDSGKDAEGADT